MGDRGVTNHLKMPAREATKELATFGVPVAVLASNAAWTSFVPIDGASLDLRGAARILDVPVITIGFDDDAGVVADFFAPDGWHGQLSVPFPEPYAFSPEDARLLGALRERGFVTAPMADDLARGLRSAPDALDAWLRAHDLERTLDLPCIEPMPARCTRRLLGQIAPDATIVEPSAARARSARPVTRTAAAPARAFSPAEHAVIDLHYVYLTQIWSMNDWKLYNRYKKHLPAERRKEVDGFITLFMNQAPDTAVRAALEAILAAAWDAADWDAVIRDPALLAYEAYDRDEWQALLDRADAARRRPDAKTR